MDDPTRSGEPTGSRDSAQAAPADSTDTDTRLTALVERLAHERLEVLPFYHDLRNEIVRPLNLHVETRYFFRRWKPHLGPVLTLLIMELRDRCYYNPRTGERRDYCWPSQEELARALGVSVRTIIRALQDPRAQQFIRIQHRYRFDAALGKKVRTSSAYVVAMDDPLRPEDEPVLARRAAERILAEETSERYTLQARTPESDLSAKMAPRSERIKPDLTVNVTSRTARDQADKLSLINMPDNLSEEEVPPRRDPLQKKNTEKQSRVRADAERPPMLPEAIIRAYRDANDREPTTLERQRLLDLIQRFDPIARLAESPTTGTAWVLAAIVEAVDSGSAFVAPRRIATICERWARSAQKPVPPDRPRRGTRRSHPAAQPPSEEGDIRPGQAASEVLAAGPDSTDVPLAEDVPLADGETDDLVANGGAFVIAGPRSWTSVQLWRLVVDEINARAAGDPDRSWLAQASLIAQEGDQLVVGAPTRFACDVVERRYGAAIQRAIATALGEERPVRFEAWRRRDAGA